MVTFSNGRKIQHFIPSGALAFDDGGWLWERPLVWFRLIKPELFGITIKSLGKIPRKGNLRWWKPWECVKLVPGGAVNKIGLTNKGFKWWMENVAPKLDFERYNIIVSLYGTKDELIYMATELNRLGITAIELNESCPNTGHPAADTLIVIEKVKVVKGVSIHPIILKISADQDGVAIAKALIGVIEAMSFNTLAWEKAFPGVRSPLHRLEKKVQGGGGGGYSGKGLQKYNWPFMEMIHRQVPELQLIASSIMEFEDLARVDALGASGYSYGTIHLPDYPIWRYPWTLFTNPCKATKIVERYNAAEASRTRVEIDRLA